MITDDTLREGLQTPGFSFTIDEKLKMAEILGNSGITRALVSYPSAHISEEEITRKIVERNYFKEVFGLGRTLELDIDKIYSTGANISLHLPFTLEDMDSILKAVRYASSKGRIVEVGLVDVTRFTDKELISLATKVSEAGADVIQLPDTKGLATPSRMRNIVELVKKNVSSMLEVHCHNDNGSSVANALAGIEAGADYVDCSIFGIGERNGITDLASIVSILELEGQKTGVNIKSLLKCYDFLHDLILEKIGPSLFDANFPVFGENTSVHTAGTHAASSRVFTGSKYSINVYTGKHMIKNILRTLNIDIPDDMLTKLVGMIKDISVSTGKSVNVEQISKMCRELIEDEKSIS